MNMNCDRCKKDFDGFTWGLNRMTAGYYDMVGCWSEYKKSPDEKVVCDDCMFVDPKYIKIYGKRDVTGNNLLGTTTYRLS